MGLKRYAKKDKQDAVQTTMSDGSDPVAATVSWPECGLLQVRGIEAFKKALRKSGWAPLKRDRDGLCLVSLLAWRVLGSSCLLSPSREEVLGFLRMLRVVLKQSGDRLTEEGAWSVHQVTQAKVNRYRAWDKPHRAICEQALEVRLRVQVQSRPPPLKTLVHQVVFVETPFQSMRDGQPLSRVWEALLEEAHQPSLARREALMGGLLMPGFKEMVTRRSDAAWPWARWATEAWGGWGRLLDAPDFPEALRASLEGTWVSPERSQMQAEVYAGIAQVFRQEGRMEAMQELEKTFPLATSSPVPLVNVAGMPALAALLRARRLSQTWSPSLRAPRPRF